MTPMFSGDISFMDCPRIHHLNKIPPDSLIVLGIPFDTSTSNRPGTRFGPRGIRTASKMLSWQKLYPWDEDIYGASVKNDKEIQVFDGGDIYFDFGRGYSVIDAIEKSISQVLKCGAYPLCLGGDHYISYPILKAICQQLKQPLALVHFDAHYDMWDNEIQSRSESRIDHGTGFTYAFNEGLIDSEHSFQIGLRTHKEDSENNKNSHQRIEFIDGFEGNSLSSEEIAKRIHRRVGDSPAYLTFDIDCLDPACAPGTGTPVCGGLSTFKALDILRRLKGLNWKGSDIVEVSPPYDHAEITALAGATIAGYLGHLLIGKNKK